MKKYERRSEDIVEILPKLVIFLQNLVKTKKPKTKS